MSEQRKVEHLQVFGVGGEQVFESFWKATGRYRLRAGWFGLAILEEEQIVFEDAVVVPAVTRWRRCDPGTIVSVRS